MMVTISASLVLYKPDLPTVEQVLRKLLAATQFAQSHVPISFELTLVDNSNDTNVFDEIVNWHEELRLNQPGFRINLIRAAGNLGYGSGNNLVIEKAVSDYHLVINPDLFVREDALHEAVNYMQAHPSVGMLTPAVFSVDGSRQYLCKRNPTLFVMFLRSFMPSIDLSVFKFILDRYEMRDCDYNSEIHSVSYPTGCFMFFRTELLKKIKGFDPKIFLHYEDADIGRRLLSIAGINYVPAVVVTHLWARDTHKSWSSKLATIKSGWYYFMKWTWGVSSATLKSAHSPDLQIEPVNLPSSNQGQGQLLLVTGANGFVGRAACAEFSRHGFAVKGVVRNTDPSLQTALVQYVAMGNLDGCTDWSARLAGIDCVVHLAALVHQMNEKNSNDSLSNFRRVNVESTINLARQAAAAGVRRFIFLSSIKVNGEYTNSGKFFTPDDVPMPQDAYSISKYEAEQLLHQLAAETGMELVIIRSPLVYGPNAKANFESMMRWLSLGAPIPLAAATQNRRSLVAIDNLVDLLRICVSHPAAANQVFLVSDGEDVSTADLLERASNAMGRSARMFYIPLTLLRWGLQLVNKFGIYRRLCGSLQVDITKTQQLLGWKPPISLQEGLRRAARAVQI